MRINKKAIFDVFPYILCLFLLWIFDAFLNMDYVAFALYIFFLLRIYKSNGKVFVKYMFMFVMFSYHLMSVFVVENYTITFYNLMKTSYKTGAFIPLLMYYILFFSVIHVMELSQRKEKIEHVIRVKIGYFGLSKKHSFRLFSVVLIVLTGVMAYRMIKTGFYSLEGIDRFVFRSTYFSSFDEKFYTYISWLLPIPLLGNNMKMKKSANLFFVIYCVYMISVGDKFGSLFMAFYFYLLVSWATKNLNKAALRKIITVSLIVLSILFAFISFQVMYEKGSSEAVITYFNNRLTGGQSDLWWGTYSSEKGESWRIVEFIDDEMSVIFNKPNDVMQYNFGIYKMMRVTAPSSVVDSYLSRGVRFAASTQASLFYYFKYTGLLIGSILFGQLSFYIVNKAIKAYTNYDVIKSVLFTMFISKLIQVMTMSDITMIGNITTILGVVVLIILKFVENRSHKLLLLNNGHQEIRV